MIFLCFCLLLIQYYFHEKFFFTGNCEYFMYNRKPEVIIPLEVLSGRWNIKMSFIIRRSSVGFLPLDMTKIEGCVDFTVGYFLHFFAGCNKWKRNTIISRENMREIFFYGSKLFVKMFSFFVFMFVQADDEVLFPIFGPGLIS